MGILPEQQCADHVSKVLDAAQESGLPVWRSISPQNAREYILRYACMKECMEIDHEIVHDSYLLAKKLKKSWGPWYIGRILFARQEEFDKQRMAADKIASEHSQVKPQMVMTDSEKDYLWATTEMKKATMAEKLDTVQQVQRRTGRTNLTFRQAYTIKAKYERTNNE